jgi:Type II secretion system (T2SS), protein L/Fimbrial assembly protein (PilN)
MGQRILALELAGDRVRGAVADRNWNSLAFTGVYEQEKRNGESDLGGALTRLLVATGKPDVVISALPSEFVAKRLLSLPFKDRRRLDQVVPFALEEHLPFPVDDAAVAFARVGSEGANTLIIAAFAPKEELRRHLELLSGAGLDPRIVTLGTLALAGLLGRARNGRSGAHLVVDINHGSTSMVLIDADGTPRAIRTLGTGLDAHSGTTLPQPVASTIFGAVRQTLLAHASEQEQPDLVLTGAAGSVATLRTQLADALAVPVHGVDEFDYSGLMEGIKSEPTRYTACVSMLLGEAPSKPLELLNFRRGEFAFHGRTEWIEALRVPTILGAVALGLAVLHLLLGISVNAHRLHLLDREIAAVSAPAIGEGDAAAAKLRLQSEIATVNKRLRQMGVSLGHGSPLDVLLALSRAIPPGLPVEVDDLQVNDAGLTLDGTADSFATVDLMKKDLERSLQFGTIKLEHAAAGTDASKVDFRLSASLGDAVAGAQ